MVDRLVKHFAARVEPRDLAALGRRKADAMDLLTAPSTLNRAAIRTTVTSQRCPQVYRRHSRWLTMREWRALGVTPIGRSLPDSEMASLIEPDGPNDTAYLLTTNYRAILDYNCSNFYAISVGVLADEIARR